MNNEVRYTDKICPECMKCTLATDGKNEWCWFWWCRKTFRKYAPTISELKRLI